MVYDHGMSTHECAPCTHPCSSCVDSASECTSCKTGYMINYQGKCVKCMQGCLQCNSDVGCEVCSPGYMAVNIVT